MQLIYAKEHKSCLMLLLICMCFDEQSAPQPKRVLSVREKEKRKKYSHKEFPETVVAGRFVVCLVVGEQSLQPTLHATDTTCNTPCQTAHFLVIGKIIYF
jgi:hypothetical protein